MSDKATIIVNKYLEHRTPRGFSDALTTTVIDPETGKYERIGYSHETVRKWSSGAFDPKFDDLYALAVWKHETENTLARKFATEIIKAKYPECLTDGEG